MHSEMANGDSPWLTSLVGASAPPSHTPATSAQITPSPCTDPKPARAFLLAVALNLLASSFGVGNGLVKHDQQRQSDAKHDQRSQEVAVRERCFHFFRSR